MTDATTHHGYRRGARPLHEYLREHARLQPGKIAYHWYGHAISYASLDA